MDILKFSAPDNLATTMKYIDMRVLVLFVPNWRCEQTYKSHNVC